MGNVEPNWFLAVYLAATANVLTSLEYYIDSPNNICVKLPFSKSKICDWHCCSPPCGDLGKQAPPTLWPCPKGIKDTLHLQWVMEGEYEHALSKSLV